MAEIDDAELEKLRQDAERNRVRAEQADAERQAAQRDLQNVVGITQQLAARVQQGNQPPPTPQAPEINDDDPITGKQLKTLVEQGVASQVAPVMQGYFQQQRQAQRQIATLSPETKETMGKWGKEVEELLNQQSPEIAAMPGAYDTACKAVRALHTEDIIAEELDKRQREASERARAIAAGEIEEEEEEQTGATLRTAAPPPQPSSTARGAAGGAKPKRVKLEPEEARMAAIMGLNSEEYDTYSHNLTRDVFGFKGRSRV